MHLGCGSGCGSGDLERTVRWKIGGRKPREMAWLKRARGGGSRPDHARALAEADCLRRLLAVYLHTDSSDDLKTKAKRALKSVIQKCTHLPALEPLLQESPPNILKCAAPS